MTDIMVREKQSFSLSPTSLNEAMKFSEILAKSDLVPKDFRNKPGNVLVAVQMGAELGLGPMQAIQNISVINGRPCVWGDSMLAIARSHREFEDIIEEFDGETATCIVKRKGQSPTVRDFSFADAKKAGLLGKQGPWQQYPKRMLAARARAFALRDSFADALRGLNSAEEVRDYHTQEVTVDPVGGDAKQTATAQLKEHIKGNGNGSMGQSQELESILGFIASATTEEEMKTVVTGAQFLDEAEQAIARTAYATRGGELRAASSEEPAHDPETGEVAEEAAGGQ